MNDRLDTSLRQGAKRFTESPDLVGPDPDDVVRRTQHRRQVRQWARGSVVTVAALAVMFTAVARQPGPEQVVMEPGATPSKSPSATVTTAEPAPPPISPSTDAPAEATTVVPPPAPAPSPEGPAPGPDAPAPDLPPPAGDDPGGPAAPPSTMVVAPAVAVALRADGIGPTRFGQDVDTVVGALTSALGPPDDPGTVEPGACVPVPTRTVRWGDLQVEFVQWAGAGRLEFDSYLYGHNAWIPGTPPPGPARPALTTPGGLGVRGEVVAYADVLAQARLDFPGATPSAPPGADLVDIDELTATHKLQVGLARDGEGYRVRYINVARPNPQAC
jgi:hypothetical protein